MNDVNKALLFSQIRRVDPGTGVQKPSKPETSSGINSFDAILDQQSEVQFSKHAERRLASRNLDVSASERAKLDQAVSSLEKKGAKDSLVLMGELAFIVNVPSKTVVTALSREQMKDQVFTNIDSTMLV